MIYSMYNELPLLYSGHNKNITKKTWVTKGVIPNVIQVSHSVVPPGEQCGLHAHDDMHELFLVEQGRGMMMVDGFATEISRGDSMVINPRESHALMNPYKEELRVVVMGILSSASSVV